MKVYTCKAWILRSWILGFLLLAGQVVAQGLSINGVIVKEDAGFAVFTVSLNSISSISVSVSYLTSNGTATEPVDYTKSSGRATIPKGQPSITISVPIVDDTIPEPDETFFVNLSNPLGATLAKSSGLGTILANDASSLPHELLFLAEKLVESKKHKLLAGNIHSNNDIVLKKGKKSEVVGDLFAVDDVDIGKKNDVDGNVTAGDDVENDGDVSGVITENAGVAVIPLPIIKPFTTGPDDFEVDKKETAALSPGAYDEVEVKKKGTLELGHDGNSGEYFMRTLNLAKKAVLRIDVSKGAVTINVSEDLKFGKSVEVRIVPNGEKDTRFVTFNFTGDDDVVVGSKAKVLGNLIAPDAEVVLAKKARFKGAICAETIEVKKRVVALHHSATGSLPKIAPDEDDDGEDVLADGMPTEFELSQNYPNPFNPSTTINFALPKAGEISLRIYNVRGQLVRTLVSGALTAGRHSLTWDGKDLRGLQVATGTYVYRLEAASFVATKKLMLLK